jgi:hypothetical protein
MARPGVQCALCEASDAGQDLIGRLGPDERLGVHTMRVDEALSARRFDGPDPARGVSDSERRHRRWLANPVGTAGHSILFVL